MKSFFKITPVNCIENVQVFVDNGAEYILSKCVPKTDRYMMGFNPANNDFKYFYQILDDKRAIKILFNDTTHPIVKNNDRIIFNSNNGEVFWSFQKAPKFAPKRAAWEFGINIPKAHFIMVDDPEIIERNKKAIRDSYTKLDEIRKFRTPFLRKYISVNGGIAVLGKLDKPNEKYKIDYFSILKTYDTYHVAKSLIEKLIRLNYDDVILK